MKNQPNPSGEKSAKKPTHDAKVRRGEGEKVWHEKIGAAWQREDGSLFVKLSGTQVVSEGFNLYKVE